jgi:hypothetical protein
VGRFCSPDRATGSEGKTLPPPTHLVRDNTGAIGHTGAPIGAPPGPTDGTKHIADADNTNLSISFNPPDSKPSFTDDSDGEDKLYKLCSGQEVWIGPDDNFTKTWSGQRVIPLDKLSAGTAYQMISFPGDNMEAYKCGRNPS